MQFLVHFLILIPTTMKQKLYLLFSVLFLALVILLCSCSSTTAVCNYKTGQTVYVKKTNPNPQTHWK